MKEAVLQQNIRLALGMRDDIFMFRINVGKFRPILQLMPVFLFLLMRVAKV